MNGVKRLTPPQSRKVNALVRRTCCNYDNGNCILLDDGDECVCPQLISYSLLCKWFRAAVLPADRLLYAELYQTGDKKKCTECGAFFASTSIIAQRRGFCYPYPRSVSFSRSGCLSACKMLSMFCLIISYSRTFFFNFP